MYTILHAPEGTNYTNMIKSVRAKVTGILQEPIQSITLKENLTDETIVSALKNGFKEIFCLEFNEESFSYSEWDSITLLANQKYSTQTWLMKYP
jgi:lipoate-protein ligase A